MIGARAKGIRVLVVDDEAPACQRLTDRLEKDAQVARVLEATNGKAAVEIIKREALDLVFLDVQMPELDGLQVIETVGAAAMPLTYLSPPTISTPYGPSKRTHWTIS
ncbi:MAG: response regulator [Bryobacteraceae bacterium]